MLRNQVILATAATVIVGIAAYVYISSRKKRKAPDVKQKFSELLPEANITLRPKAAAPEADVKPATSAEAAEGFESKPQNVFEMRRGHDVEWIDVNAQKKFEFGVVDEKLDQIVSGLITESKPESDMGQSVAESFASLIGEGPEAFLQRDPVEVQDEVSEVVAAKVEASLPQVQIPVEDKAPKVESFEPVFQEPLPVQKEDLVEVEEEQVQAVEASSRNVEPEPRIDSSSEKASEQVSKQEEPTVSDHHDVDDHEDDVEDDNLVEEETKTPVVSDVEEDVVVQVEKVPSAQPPIADADVDLKSDVLAEESQKKSGEQSLGSFEPISFPQSTGDHETVSSTFEAESSPVSFELISPPSVSASLSTSSVTSDVSTSFQSFHSSNEDPEMAMENLDKIMSFTKELIASGASSMVADALIEKSVEKLMGDSSMVDDDAAEETKDSSVGETDEANSVGQLSVSVTSEEATNDDTLSSNEDQVPETTTVNNGASVPDELTKTESSPVKADEGSSAKMNPESSKVLNVVESNESFSQGLSDSPKLSSEADKTFFEADVFDDDVKEPVWNHSVTESNGVGPKLTPALVPKPKLVQAVDAVIEEEDDDDVDNKGSGRNNLEASTGF